MIKGLRNEVEHRGKTYTVESEDRGNTLFESRLSRGAKVLVSVKASYAGLADSPELDERLLSLRLSELHWSLINGLRADKFQLDLERTRIVSTTILLDEPARVTPPPDELELVPVSAGLDPTMTRGKVEPSAPVGLPIPVRPSMRPDRPECVGYRGEPVRDRASSRWVWWFAAIVLVLTGGLMVYQQTLLGRDASARSIPTHVRPFRPDPATAPPARSTPVVQHGGSGMTGMTLPRATSPDPSRAPATAPATGSSPRRAAPGSSASGSSRAPATPAPIEDAPQSPPASRWAGELVALDQVDVLPRPLDPAIPEYPQRAHKRGKQGIVTLSLLIDDRGKVSRIELVDGVPDSGLNEAAMAAVLEWRFQPARKEGEAVRVWHPVTFQFSLDKGVRMRWLAPRRHVNALPR